MTAEIRVAHVIEYLRVGGLENGVINLVNTRAAGVTHTIVCLKTANAFRDLVRPEVSVLTIGKGHGHDIRAFLRLVRLLRRLRPDVVHSRNWGTFDAILAARLAGVGVVVHGEHGRDVSDPDGLHARRNRLRRLCAPLVSRFVAVSDDLRRWLVEHVGIPPQKVVRICNGVDVERFTPDDGAGVRAALEIPPDDIVVGTVARLDPVKDQIGLIRAFDVVRRAHREATLLIVGDGPCRPALEKLAASLDMRHRVRFLGERRDVCSVLRAIDVFTLPSIAEGISNTVLEAMATGLPIVATDVGGNPELVEDGVNGLLVPKRNPAALATALLRYVDDPALRAVHGKSSRQRAVDLFALDRMRHLYHMLYATLCTPDSKGH